MTIKEFRRTHRITKKSIYQATGIGRKKLNTIEADQDKASVKDVMSVVQFLKQVDSTLSFADILD